MRQHDKLTCNHGYPVTVDTVINSGLWLTINQCAVLVKRNPLWVYRVVHNGYLRHVRLPGARGQYFIEKASALKRWSS